MSTKPESESDGVKVGFDAQIFRLLANGGISRYFTQLISGLNQYTKSEAIPLFRFHGSELLGGQDLQRLHWAMFWGLRKLGYDPAARPVNFDAKKYDFNIYHATYYQAPPPKQGRLKYPLVSTVYDMTPEELPEHFGLRKPHAHKKAWLEASRAIVCVSTASADAVGNYWPHLARRLHVIHLSTQFWGQTGKPPKEKAEQPFFLYIGRRESYKQVKLIWSLLSRVPGSELVMVGGGPLRRHERTYLFKLGIEHRVKTIKADDSTLVWLYQHCAATVIPSLSEGFSLPLIESLACNAPILASDLPVHREVGGGYATLLSPHSPNHWHDALVAALEGQIPKPSQKLTPKDLEDLRNHFSIARMARDHASFYGTINRR